VPLSVEFWEIRLIDQNSTIKITGESMKIKINAKFLRDELNKCGLSYSEMAKITGININRWKYVTRRGGYLTDSELQKVVEILGCNQDLIIDQDFQIQQNTPLEINLLVQKLYEKRKGDIQPAYESIMTNFLKNGKLENFISEANRLLTTLFNGEQLSIDPASGVSIIVDEFLEDRIFSRSHTELDEQTITGIFSIVQDSLPNNSAQKALAVFLYALVLFDVIFLEECISSVTQFSMERFGEKTDQYCSLTLKIENLRDTLIDYFIEKKLKMENIMANEITEEILDGVHLMLLSCYKVGKHLNGDYFSSEYVNRTELDAIITRLTRILKNLGIEVPDAIYGMSGTRFYKHLYFIRSILQSKKKKTDSLDFFSMAIGFNFGKNQT